MSEEARYRSLSEIQSRLSPFELRFERRRRTAGLWLGPLGFMVLELVRPSGLNSSSAHLVAILAWVLVWWITEAVPLPVTALLGPMLAVLLGVAPVREALAPFADPVIFLFLGGFIIAEGMIAHGLDRRIAGGVLGLRWMGARPLRIVMAFMLIAAAMSMWMSNSVTTAILYPMALAVLGAVARAKQGNDALPHYTTGLLLACAYASSLGGVGTPLGSPPNLIALGYLENLAGVRINFFTWMVLCVPVMVVMLVVMFGTLRVIFPPEIKRFSIETDLVCQWRADAGPWTTGQRNVAIAFGVAVVLWLLPGVCTLLVGSAHPISHRLQAMLPEGIVAVIAAGFLFVMPVDWAERRFTLTWNHVVRIDWGTLILFGGGLSLGGMMFKTGLAEKLGAALVQGSGASTRVALTVVFTTFAIYFTEVVSNTAAATMLVPLAISAAQAAGVSPVEPAMGCALGCSMAFMFPVATPPNAIIYGSGQVRLLSMIKAGWWLNLLACIVISVSVLVLVPLVLTP